MSAPLAPQAPRRRIEALDGLRGLAVLGIFVINIVGFGIGPVAFDHPDVAGGDSTLNLALWTFTSVYVDGSMRGLFSAMFGASVMLFAAKPVRPGDSMSVADLHYRRMLWLLLFGLVHGYVLLAPGDVLYLYALAGLVLYPLRVLSARWLLLIAAVVLVSLSVRGFLGHIEAERLSVEAQHIEHRLAGGEVVTEREQTSLERWRAGASTRESLEDQANEWTRTRTADAATVFKMNARATGYIDGALLIPNGTWPALFMMLVGMALFRTGVMTGDRSPAFYLRLTLIAYAIGLGFRAWAVSLQWQSGFSASHWSLACFAEAGRAAVTLGHVGLFFLLWRAFSSSRLMQALICTGRMALTNYLAQTVIANLLFSGIGLGLCGVFDRASLYVIMLLIWVAQLLGSTWWLARRRFGPAEWLWRSLTYWRFQPTRRIAPDTA